MSLYDFSIFKTSHQWSLQTIKSGFPFDLFIASCSSALDGGFLNQSISSGLSRFVFWSLDAPKHLHDLRIYSQICCSLNLDSLGFEPAQVGESILRAHHIRIHIVKFIYWYTLVYE